ncbi:MAG: alanyl-tRNA editing protein [Acidobacteria bacterium]|nr:alanyl-tRNA editing protein [Acidobacteriota bacterium]
MTERLYYHDSFLREFDARVVSAEPGGERWEIVLDRTAFYPTSGGQPNDLGVLGGAAVLDVLERNEHSVVHVTDRALARGPIHGVLDWPRRFDHMQQHTGQHLLSAAFVEVFHFPTVSFHLGREVSTIDLAAAKLETRQLEAAERRTNEIIFEDRAVRVTFGTAQQLAEAGVRKQVEREGILRAIEIEGFDRQPCGGTHVARTGQVGLVLLRKCEKVKENWRVEFVCGERARRAARGDLTTLAEAARLLSCGQGEVPAMVARALEERQSSYRARQRLVEQLAEFQALTLLATEARAGKSEAARVVLRVFEDADADYLRMLAGKLVAEPGVQALLAARAGGHVVFAQSAELGANMNALLRESLQAAGGKGGGTRDFAQGSVPDAGALEGILQRALERLRA